jgi:hypothetical protein
MEKTKFKLTTIDDVNENNILHLNLEDGKRPSKHHIDEFLRIEEMSIQEFMYSVLPACTSVEALLLNRYEQNMVSLMKDGSTFKTVYKNTPEGESEIKESVRSQGGGVDGVLRFSIMWAFCEDDNSDLDAHSEEGNGCKIFYSHRVSAVTGGELDIDIINPQDHKKSGRKVVENITYADFPEEDEKFKFLVHNYANRRSKGFKAEIEYMGVQHQYEYPHSLSQGQKVVVAKVKFENGVFSIEHKLKPVDGHDAVKNVFGLQTRHFHKVNAVTLNPGHWNNKEEGNKEFLFFLNDCHSSNTEGEVNELSGIGFKANEHNDLILRLKGHSKNLIKVKFK